MDMPPPPPPPRSGPGGSNNKFFPVLKDWIDRYAPSGVEDKRAIETFMDCETTERHNQIRNELRAISSGNYHVATIERTVGKNRSVKHGTYEAWGKLMLLWMAGYKGS